MNKGIIEEFNSSFNTSFIDSTATSNLAYRPQFVSNNYREGKKVLSSIEDELRLCDHFRISVAFITMSGITPLLMTLRELEKRGIPGEILTTDYLTFSDPRALRTLHSLSNLRIRMYDSEAAGKGFHTKGYIFRKDDDKIKEFVRVQMENYGIKPVDIIITSAKKNENIDDWAEIGKELRGGKDLYLIGASSSGKSSLINSYMHHYKNESRNLISTSPYPGTTVSTITIPLDNRTYIYDTPGILIPDSMYFNVEKTALKRIIPKTEIKPQTYQLNKDQSLLLGGLARFEIVDGAKSSYTVYASNEVDILRTKLAKANKTFDSLVESGKIQPISNTITGSESLVEHEFILPNKSVDIVIFGYLWINVKGNGQKIILKAPKGIGVCVRDAII